MQHKYNLNTELKALVAFWSATGNTEKVASTIWQTLKKEKVTTDLISLSNERVDDFYKYDIVFFGAPSYMWLPPTPVQSFIKERVEYHNKRGDIKLCAPEIPGKIAVVFCTYSGPHTGINEAIPVNKYMGQFFEHLGFKILGEWYIVGEFHGKKEHSTRGRLGDIRGRPNKQDLAEVERDVSLLIKSIQAATA